MAQVPATSSPRVRLIFDGIEKWLVVDVHRFERLAGDYIR